MIEIGVLPILWLSRKSELQRLHFSNVTRTNERGLLSHELIEYMNPITLPIMAATTGLACAFIAIGGRC